MALDESKDEDTTFDVGGFSVVVSPLDSEVIRGAGGVVVDYVKDHRGEGFSIRVGQSDGCGDCSC